MTSGSRTYWLSNLRANTFCIYSEQKHWREESLKIKPSLCSCLSPSSAISLSKEQPPPHASTAEFLYLSLHQLLLNPVFRATFQLLFFYLLLCLLAFQLDKDRQSPDRERRESSQSTATSLCLGTLPSNACLDHSQYPSGFRLTYQTRKTSHSKGLQPDLLITLPDCGHTQHYGYLQSDSIPLQFTCFYGSGKCTI